MKKAIDVIKWIFRNFFPISITVFILIYLRWFRLTPLMFFNDPDYAYIVGLILLGLYSLSAILLNLAKNRRLLRVLLLIPTILFFLGNILHARAFFPSIEFITKCNGNTYYITWMHPFGDYQWTFSNVTIWKGFFKYRSFFFGYSGGSYRIVCDEEKNEANIIRTFNDVLVYTDGENPRHYDEYTSTQLGNHLYFLSRKCNDWVPSTCGSLTYTLYECNLNHKSCDTLHVQYTLYDTRNPLVLEANETTNEINLFDDFNDNPNRIKIFTYGDHPRCYVEGCEILE